MKHKLLLVLLVGSSLFLAAAILGDWLPHLRGPAPETAEWYWPYLLRPVARWWPSIAASLLMLAISAAWLRKQDYSRPQLTIFLSMLFAASLALQLSFIYADRGQITAELIDRTLSNLASGFFEPAAEISDINQTLRNYPQEMPQFVSEHARTHPPGLITANWITIQLFSRLDKIAAMAARVVHPARCTDLWLLNQPVGVSAALGAWSIMPLFVAAISVFPAYAVAQQLLDKDAVPLATVMVASQPALILFAPKSVQIYAPLSLLLFWLFHAGILRRSSLLLFLAGAVLSLMSFLSLGNAAMLFLLGVYFVFAYLFTRNLPSNPLQTVDFKRFAQHLAFFVLGAASIWLVYWTIWDVTPWAIASVGLQQHYQLVTNLRNYAWWINWNLIDLLIYSGWPVALGFLGTLLILPQGWRQHHLRAVDALAAALAILILLLNFSGTARGEVGRIWLFFMPLLAYPAVRFWTNYLPGKRNALLIIGLQLLLVICLGLAWRPVRAVIVVAEKPEMREDSPDVTMDFSLEGEPLRLSGFSRNSEEVVPGGIFSFTLFWEADGPATRPYTVFTHLVDADGTLIGQQDNWPVNGSWPPTCWKAGDAVIDDYYLQLPNQLEPGTYYLQAGLYDAANGSRLLFEHGRDAQLLDTIVIPPG